ncbi:MAG: DJ-1/PfpI family protein [Spirochaetes bacterium]|nr:DJ-1/PfpI family protein [Spirochaetota bacterium]
MKVNCLLFNGFTALDVFGPVEVFGCLDKIYQIEYFSQYGGMIKSNRTNIEINTKSFDSIEDNGILLIPGGTGTRTEVDNTELIGRIKESASKSKYVLSVCTGSALLAKTGLLKNKRATTNKSAFDWVKEQDSDVEWIGKARWIVDGKFYSSSGVSAGMDMALGFIQDVHGKGFAENIAKGLEYIWNSDKDNDPFSV